MLGKTIRAFVVSWYHLPWIEQYVDDHLGYLTSYFMIRVFKTRLPSLLCVCSEIGSRCFNSCLSKVRIYQLTNGFYQPFLPRQDSTWIKVTIKEKYRVLFYVHTASDLMHLKELKGWIQKTQLLSFRPTPYPPAPHWSVLISPTFATLISPTFATVISPTSATLISPTFAFRCSLKSTQSRLFEDKKRGSFKKTFTQMFSVFIWGKKKAKFCSRAKWPT